MDYGPLGLIRALLETLGDVLNPKQRKKSGFRASDSNKTSVSPEALAESREFAENDPGEQYWKELFMEKLEAAEKERDVVTEMMIEDYEAKHEAEAGQEPDSGITETAEEQNAEIDSAGNIDSEPAADDGGNSDSGDSGVYDGYIG
jgi:hypothetical protein